MISITIDTEWSPDHVLKDVLKILNEYGVSATLFSTHNDNLRAVRHERALHPNFFKEKEESEILSDLSELYPDAEGIRSHGMYVHTNF